MEPGSKGGMGKVWKAQDMHRPYVSVAESRLVDIERCGLRCKPGLYVTLVDQSPPKLGGVPSRSEGGAVCSKTRSDLMDFRAALLINSVRFAEIYKEPLRGTLNRYLGFALSGSRSAPPRPSLREGIPA